MGFLDFVGVNGEVRSGEGMLASPCPGSVLPPWAMQASPPRSTPPPPLRERMRLKTLHTGIHTKPTRASGGGAEWMGAHPSHKAAFTKATPERNMGVEAHLFLLMYLCETFLSLMRQLSYTNLSECVILSLR